MALDRDYVVYNQSEFSLKTELSYKVVLTIVVIVVTEIIIIASAVVLKVGEIALFLILR